MKKLHVIGALFLVLATSINPCLASITESINGWALEPVYKVYMNGYYLPSYNINNQIVVRVSDLPFYGFAVDHNQLRNEYRVSLDNQLKLNQREIETNIINKPPSSTLPYSVTESVVRINAHTARCYKVSGEAVVALTALQPLGEIIWNRDSRQIKFWTADFNGEKKITTMVGNEFIHLQQSTQGEGNNGRAVFDGDWVYFSNTEYDCCMTNRGIYKYHPQSGELVKISSQPAEQLSLFGNRLFFENELGVHKMSLDGVEDIVIYPRQLYDFFIVDGDIVWCYNGIQQMTHDGRHRKTLYDGEVHQLYHIENDQAIFRRITTNGKHDFSVYTVSLLNPRNPVKLIDTNHEYGADNLIVLEDGFIYTTRTEPYKVKKYTPSTGSQDTLANDRACHIGINGDWVYYSNLNDDWKPYRVRLDGSHRQRIIDNKRMKLVFSIGDKLMYLSGSFSDIAVYDPTTQTSQELDFSSFPVYDPDDLVLTLREETYVNTTCGTSMQLPEGWIVSPIEYGESGWWAGPYKSDYYRILVDACIPRREVVDDFEGYFCEELLLETMPEDYQSVEFVSRNTESISGFPAVRSVFKCIWQHQDGSIKGLYVYKNYILVGNTLYKLFAAIPWEASTENIAVIKDALNSLTILSQ